MTQATVLIPTFDHGPTLFYSARSALAQTVEDLEVFIVGDGVPDVTREVVGELKREDERVRFFDNPKGTRNGEVHRHAALKEAGGEVVCYLSDDDLWFPDHVSYMRRLLTGADFAHSLPIRVEVQGGIYPYPVDLTLDSYRELLLFGTQRGTNRIPLSCGAHTLEMYRRLPYGWRTTPTSIATDFYMWKQFLADPECRAVSGTCPTVLNFPSPQRRDWRAEERLAELERWSGKIQDPDWRNRFVLEVLDSAARHRAEEVMRLQRQVEEERGRALEETMRLQRQVEEERGRVLDLRQQIQSIQNSRTWKLLTQLGRAKAKMLDR